MLPSSKNDDVWFKARVVKGKGIAKTLGFPTLNLDNPSLLEGEKEGVYACRLKIAKKIYQGVLYYGPRLVLGEKENILEVFVFDLEGEVYGKIVSFQRLGFIRQVFNFPNFASLKKQLLLDSEKAKELLK